MYNYSKNNFTTQFTELMYKFKDLLRNRIIYKSNQIKPNMQHEINQSLKFSQSDIHTRERYEVRNTTHLFFIVSENNS